MLVFIDNFDSFTYNAVYAFQVLGAPIRVYRNDEISSEEILKLNPKGIILGPGPGNPSQAGITIPLLLKAAGNIPILGICLGHQAIAEAFGAFVEPTGTPMHGKKSTIHHDCLGIFKNLKPQFEVGRYHSLAVASKNFPACLKISCWASCGMIMGLRHRLFPIEGVQFHPESLLTDAEGLKLLKNFYEMC